MKFNAVLILDDLIQTNNEMILKNPLTSILVPFIPTLFSFSTYISFFEVKTNVPYSIEIDVLDPDENIITSHKAPIKIDHAENESNFSGSMHIIFKNVEFKSQGTHSIRVSNGEHSLQFYFPVILGS